MEGAPMNQWNIKRGSETTGPFSLDQLKEWLENGDVEHDDQVQKVGSEMWLPLHEALQNKTEVPVSKPASQPEGPHLLTCEACGGKVSSAAAACPHCGQPVEPPKPQEATSAPQTLPAATAASSRSIITVLTEKKKLLIRVLIGVLAIALILVLISVFTTSSKELATVHFTASSVEEIISNSFMGPKTEERIREHYKDRSFKDLDLDFNVVREIEFEGKHSTYKKVLLAVSGKNAYGATVTENRYSYIRDSKDGDRLDWEASVGYNSTKLKPFMAEKKTVPTSFRLIAKLDNYYNFDFSNDADTHYSIELKTRGRTTIYGYVYKKSEEGKKLYELLKDGESHNVIVKIAFLPDARSSENVLIYEMLSDEWVLKK